MPDWKPGVLGGAFSRDMLVDHLSYSAKCMAIPEEMVLSVRFDVTQEIRSVLRNLSGATRFRCPWIPGLLLLRQDAQIVVASFVRRPIAQSIEVVASSRLALAATICCIMAMKRFWSALLKSATVSR